MRKVLIAGACLAAACTPNEGQASVTQEAAVSASPGFISRDWGATTLPPETTTTEAPTTTTTVEQVVEVSTTVYVAPRRTTTTAAYVAPARSSSSTPPDYIKQCESNGNYRAVNPNGHFGAWQFSQSTWESVGGTGRPDHASPAEQDYRASILWDGGNGASHWECA